MNSWTTGHGGASSDGLVTEMKAMALLSVLSEKVLRDLAGKCRTHMVRPGAMVMYQHDASCDVYFLMSGRARVNVYSAAGKQVSFRDIDPGAVFGELSAIDGRPRSADVEAVEPCRVLVMPRSVFQDGLVAYPALASAAMCHLSAQVRALTDRVFEFSTLAVRNRVHAELIRLASHSGQEDNQAVLSPAPTHSQIASRISTHREAVTRELNRLEGLDVLERRGRSVRIKNLSRLKRMLEDVGA